MNLLELASFIATAYAALIPYYITYRVLPENRSLAYLSFVLGLMLSTHSIHHLGGFVENHLAEDIFGLVSAIAAVLLGLVYLRLRRRVK
ncbi:MAG: hypothetical protein HYU39_08345 [Thaumarchaeota archaeon]|nr:hypothetical protein [Nitrososphaerota archaeon]